MNVETRGTAPHTGVVLSGCEPWSHIAESHTGALVLHGFTGSPASVRNVAEALAAAGHDVEMPRLPGHGTTIDDMLTTAWGDWAAEAARAYDRLAARVGQVLVVGQSMGGTLALTMAFERPATVGVVVINPVTRSRGHDVIEMIDDYLDDGIVVAPGEGSDIADPDATDVSYSGTPLAQLRSLLTEGVAPITGRYDELTMPLQLFTSRNDHVVEPADSEHLAATYGGAVEHTWLERSFHVATRDFDRELLLHEIVAFAARVLA